VGGGALSRRIAVGLLAGVSAVVTVASASAVPTAANVQISILVGTDPITTRPPTIPNGGTANVPVLDFVAGFKVSNAGPDVATVKAQFELPTGLRWGADGPDPSEDCTEAVTTVCQAALGSSPTSTTPPQESAWGWNVSAAAPGSYTLKAQVVESSTSDPDAADNSSSVTVVVTQPPGSPPTPPPPPSPPPAKASAAKLLPAKPKAGSLVSATVRVTAGGAPVRPTGVSCIGTLGGAKLRGTAKAASGTATCGYRTPKSAKGKTLRGKISFSARGTKFTKSFSAKLG
jgi:hypothetical protein